MMFRPYLAELVMSGGKTVTRRPVSPNPKSPWFRERCALNVGQDYAIQPGRGKSAIGRAVVTSVTRMRLGHLSQAEAEAEGFDSPGAFEDVIRELHGTYDPDVQVWRIGLAVWGAWRPEQQVALDVLYDDAKASEILGETPGLHLTALRSRVYARADELRPSWTIALATAGLIRAARPVIGPTIYSILPAGIGLVEAARRG